MAPFRIFSLGLAALAWQPVPASGDALYHGVFRELPPTVVTPEGWLAEVLRRQKDGLAMNREASGYPYDTDLWVGKLPKGQWKDYEQMAYFLDGAYRCGLLLNDRPLTDLALASINYVLDHPEPDGKLGPTEKDYGRKLSPDEADGPTSTGEQWPFAVFTRLLMAYHAATGDQRVIEGLSKHYRALPENFGMAPRDVMNVEGMCWLYTQTGDRLFLDLAERTWQNCLKGRISSVRGQYNLETLAAAPRLRGHGVTVSEQAKIPTLLYLATGKKEYLAASLGAFTALRRDHEQVDGVLSSDAALSGKDPSHSHETCVIIDYPWSLGYLAMATGDPQWADTVERAVLNAGMSVIDRDFRSHQYYSAPNQMAATFTSSHPSNGNRARPWQQYRPDHLPACCTGNLQRMIPTYANRLWLTDGRGGIATMLYGPNTVTAEVGADGTAVTIRETTGYPFDGAIELSFDARQPVKFPLYLRIPSWAENAQVSVNGMAWKEAPKHGTFFKMEREFAPGDVVKLELPMDLRMERPVENAVSIVRGPLLYVLKIGEKHTPDKKTLAGDADFPAWNVTSESAWNYSLALSGSEEVQKIKITEKPVSDFPWSQETAPVALTVPARKIPSWTATPENENPPLPKPPFELAAETEEVSLIPCGATQLRVSVFPSAR